MDNTRIIPVRFGKERIVVTEYRMQHDWGQVLDFIDIPLPEAFEARFSNSVSGQSVGQIGYNNRVRIPKQFFESGEPIYCYITVHDEETDGRTVYTTKVPIKPSTERTEEEPEPEEESIITQAITALNTAVDVTSKKALEASESADRAEHAADGIEAYVERAEAAQQASESARDRAVQAETNSSASASIASEKASEAISSAATASQSALTAEIASESAQEYATASAESASASAESASQASEHSSTAGSKATEASGYASNANASAQTASQKALEASQSASTAVQAKTDAESAKTASETAQAASESARDGAVTAKADAESARDEAQSIANGITGKVEQIDSNTTRIESLEDDRYKPYPTDTASGSIASFPDGADDIPLKSCIVQVEPVQEGSGDPSPDNIRPITGWTGCEIVRANANLWNNDWYTLGNIMSLITDETNDFYGYYNGYVKRWDDAQIENGNENLFPNGVDKLTVTAEIGCIYKESGAFTFRIYFKYTDGTEDYNGGNATARAQEKMTIIRASTIGKKCTGFRISTSAGISNSGGAVRRIMVSANDERDIIAPIRTTYPITFPSESGTIYGAYINVTSGKLTITFAESSNLDVLNWSYFTSGKYFYAVLPNRFLNSDSDTGIGLWDRYKYYGNAPGTVLQNNMPDMNFGFTSSSANRYIYVKDSRFENATDFRASLEGSQIIYTMSKDNWVEIQLTPQEIKTLLGNNNLWADTGDTSVTYRADTKLYIGKKIAETVNQ